MTRDAILQNLLDGGNDVLLASDAVRAGLSRPRLSKFAEEGILERVGRGVYIEAGSMGDELYSLQARAPKIVYSHETALFLHGMTDRTPPRYSITVPSSYKPSSAIKVKCNVYYVKPNLAALGRTGIPSGMGHDVAVYDVERTVCDVARSRNRIDNQVFLDALKNYAARPDSDLGRLEEYARVFGVYKLLRQYLEVLL
jgi:predicted transcriptional regulator of viral defense system